MAEQTGVVQEVKVTPRGGKTAYDLVIAGQSFGYGLYPPKCKVGDYVKFEIDDSRGYKNVARNTLKVSANKPPAEALAEAVATAPKQSTAGGSVDMKQEVISRQSALNSAIEFMKLLQAAGALPATSTKGKGQEVLEGILNEYKKVFYESSTGVAYKELTPSSAKEATPEAEAAPEVEAANDQWI